MATEIPHPLQLKVDEVIEKRKKELGGLFRPGDQISMTSFESIRNKAYVRRRLEERGFKQLTGSALMYSLQLTVSEEAPKPKKKLKKYSQEDVIERLKYGAISNEKLTQSDRNKLSTTVSHLRRIGFEIEKEKKWSDKSGMNYLIYKLKTSNSGELSEAC